MQQTLQVPLPEESVDTFLPNVTRLARDVWGFDHKTVYLSPAPLYHAAPLRFTAATIGLGGTVVVMESFDAERSLELIAEHSVTHSQWVPTMFVRMLKLPEAARVAADTSTLRVVLHGAAPCPLEIKRAMITWWGPVLHEYYSATESSGMALIGPQEWLDHPGSVGRAAVGVIRICREDGSLAEVGEVGAIFFERDRAPFSYHRDEAATTASRHPDHPTWTTTGDLGFVDPDGYLHLTDRKAFMIISGGVNIYPQEIEDCLVVHELVTDVAVLGVPDEEMGQRVKAFVQLAPGIALSEGDVWSALDAHVRRHLAGFKVPREWEARPVLPRSPTGKLVKRSLLTKT